MASNAAPPAAGNPYFVDPKKGEVSELRGLLTNVSIMKDPAKKREVIKKVIGYMTHGIDVSSLFPNMVMQASTTDMIIKKMVYMCVCVAICFVFFSFRLSSSRVHAWILLRAVVLFIPNDVSTIKSYCGLGPPPCAPGSCSKRTLRPTTQYYHRRYLTKYALENSELALLCVNTLCKDCEDMDPMIRGLALRSLTGLRLASLVEYILNPLGAGLRDKSAYVRKTAVVGVMKLFHVLPETIEESGMIDTVKKMIADPDAQARFWFCVLRRRRRRCRHRRRSPLSPSASSSLGGFMLLLCLAR